LLALNHSLITRSFVYTTHNEAKIHLNVIENNTAKLFRLSEPLLLRYAPSFHATITNRQQAVQAAILGSLQISNVDHETFMHFTKWLIHQPYWDKTCVTTDAEAHRNFDEEYFDNGPLYTWVDEWILVSAKVYLFACAYDIAQLRDDALARQVRSVRKLDGQLSYFLVAVEYVYANTETESPLRKVLVDGFCAEKFDGRESKDSLVNYPKEFLVDVLWRHRACGQCCENRTDQQRPS
jgi:hypothetical protein